MECARTTGQCTEQVAEGTDERKREILDYYLTGALDEVQAAVGLDNVAETTNGERKRRLLKRCLHLAAAKGTEVAARARRRAVAGVSFLVRTSAATRAG